jgi:hypothetical protein
MQPADLLSLLPCAAASGLRAGGRKMSLHSPPSKAQLGVAVPALVLPRGEGDAAADAAPEPALLFFGIVDFLQARSARSKIGSAGVSTGLLFSCEHDMQAVGHAELLSGP